MGTYIVVLTDGGSGSDERITAIGSQGCVPEAPLSLDLSEVTGGSVTLSWTAPAHSAISGYRILRGTDAVSLSVIAPDTGSTATRYVDASVSPSTTYAYAVVALSAAGEGAPSVSASTTTLSPNPEAKPGKSGSDPTLVPRSVPPASSTPGSTSLTLTPLFDRITLDWNTPSGDGVTGYWIWRGASAGELAVLVSDTGATSTSYVARVGRGRDDLPLRRGRPQRRRCRATVDQQHRHPTCTKLSCFPAQLVAEPLGASGVPISSTWCTT